MAEANEYLTFTLGGEAFAYEVAMVREVVDYTGITEVPLMPGYLPGLFNLRGTVVSVIDLHLMMGLPSVQKTKNTCIIISEINVEGELLLAGTVADSVHEVIYLNNFITTFLQAFLKCFSSITPVVMEYFIVLPI